MSDADLVRAALHIHDHDPAGLDNRTANALARVIATWWYAGDDTDYYTFVSIGAVPDNPQDLWRRMAPAANGAPPADRRALDFLGSYLLRHAGRGPVPGWQFIWLDAGAEHVR
ncbi:hypothetical protein [Amycolatopsis anabasis]|uniref:hypothetical protein n=1 Tax=Amycolatopsis anabasis TaxID=1840409 RepID=UPI00131BDD14|nr:hypothetical protein [Amycolatopsis anabasis]